MSKNNVNLTENVEIVEQDQEPIVVQAEGREHTKVADIWQKTVQFGKKASDGIQKGAVILAEKTKEEIHAQRLKKYNPIFEDQYNDSNFNLPNMIVIVDDAVRKGIDVCEGAIGWLGKANGMEVFYLYDEAVEMSGIKFVPTPICDAVYYVDHFNKKRFVQVDCIFSKAHEEKIAELEHIAYSLGAKSITIEIMESDQRIESVQHDLEKSTKVKSKKITASSSEKFESDICIQSRNVRNGKNKTTFEGNTTPVRPTLKWYANDDNINGLIEMRCSGNNSIQNKHLVLEGSSSATMSQKTAYAIDNAVAYMNKEVGDKASAKMARQAARENSSKLLLDIEF